MSPTAAAPGGRGRRAEGSAVRDRHLIIRGKIDVHIPTRRGVKAMRRRFAKPRALLASDKRPVIIAAAASAILGERPRKPCASWSRSPAFDHLDPEGLGEYPASARTGSACRKGMDNDEANMNMHGCDVYGASGRVSTTGHHPDRDRRFSPGSKKSPLISSLLDKKEHRVAVADHRRRRHVLAIWAECQGGGEEA